MYLSSHKNKASKNLKYSRIYGEFWDCSETSFWICFSSIFLRTKKNYIYQVKFLRFFIILSLFIKNLKRSASQWNSLMNRKWKLIRFFFSNLSLMTGQLFNSSTQMFLLRINTIQVEVKFFEFLLQIFWADFSLSN